ncbi:MAG: ABC transporter ATP-binding protein [Actinomycetota bacterium]|nr:ABC transporter ATP-binding protein [Actinomycetota bacterium]
MKDIIVDFQNVFFSYGERTVLENVSFSVRKNDFIALIGPNGGGKTTVLKLILGLLKPERGTVSVFGKKPEEGRKFTGYMPQSAFFDLSFPASVFDVVIMGRYHGPVKKYGESDKKAVLNALSTVGMIEYRNHHISMLSGGQLQRVLIARAIVREPELLLLDEPMSSVDPATQESIYELFHELNKKMAIIFVTHDIGAISSYIDRVFCLNQKLYYHGPREGSLGKLAEAYNCPVEILAHGVPHRVLGRHKR